MKSYQYKSQLISNTDRSVKEFVHSKDAKYKWVSKSFTMKAKLKSKKTSPRNRSSLNSHQLEEDPGKGSPKLERTPSIKSLLSSTVMTRLSAGARIGSSKEDSSNTEEDIPHSKTEIMVTPLPHQFFFCVDDFGFAEQT